MLTSMNFGQYVPEDSFIHKLDPRAKLFGLIFIISALFTEDNFLSLALWVVILCFIVKLSKISLRIILKSIRPIMYLALFTFAFNLFMADFVRAFFLSARLLVLMAFAILLPLTTAPLELADGLETLLNPFAKIGFPAHDIATMIGLALRFIPLLAQETDKIIKAQLSRGARLDQGNIFQRVKSFFPVLIPLFVIIFRRADSISLAMTVRGYDSSKIRTRMNPLSWKLNDSLALLFCALVSVLIYVIK